MEKYRFVSCIGWLMVVGGDLLLPEKIHLVTKKLEGCAWIVFQVFKEKIN